MGGTEPLKDDFMKIFSEESAALTKLCESVKKISEENSDLLEFFSTVQQISDSLEEFDFDLPEVSEWKAAMQESKRQSIKLEKLCKIMQTDKEAFKSEFNKYLNSDAASQKKCEQLKSIMKVVNNLQGQCKNFAEKLSPFTKQIEEAQRNAEAVFNKLQKLKSEAESQKNWNLAKTIGALLGSAALYTVSTGAIVLTLGLATPVAAAGIAAASIAGSAASAGLIYYGNQKAMDLPFLYEKIEFFSCLVEDMRLFTTLMTEIHGKSLLIFDASEQQDAMGKVLEYTGQQIREKEENARKDLENLKLQQENANLRLEVEKLKAGK